MENTLLVIEFILTALITVAVLLQKSSSIGLGVYSGSNESIFGAKGPMAFLAKLTFVMAILFIINTVSLSYVFSKKHNSSVVDSVKIDKKSAPTIPTPPSVPTAPNSK